MTIGSHAITFEGRDVVEYDPETGITQPQKNAYVLRRRWNDETPFEEKWSTLLKDPNHQQLEALILGVWG
ncbi:MAG: hypothetical protein AAFX99_32295, partial [Myxococcota bacterium]